MPYQLLKLFLAACVLSIGSVQGAVIYQQNFDTYTVGQDVVGQDGWVGAGAGPSLVNTATQLSGNSLLGPVNSGVNSLNTFARSMGESAANGEIYTLSFDTFAKSSPLITHSSGLGLGRSSSAIAGSLAGALLWVPIEGQFNTFGWMFDARILTGDNSKSEFVVGGYDSVQTLHMVVDTIAMEVYGQYDFGAGLQETAHFSISESNLTGMDAIVGYSDYRGANGGATTPFGKQFSNAEFDNLLLSTSGSVSLPGSLGLMLWMAVLLRRRIA